MEERRKLLRELASLRGITDSYCDVTGEEHETTDEGREALLDACGYRIETDGDLHTAIEEIENHSWSRLIDEVIVRTLPELEGGLRFQLGEHPLRVSLKVATESGEHLSAKIPGEDLLHMASKQVADRTIQRFALPFPLRLDTGYHSLTVEVETSGGAHVAEARLIVCPERAFLPDWYADGQRVAGIGISLYGLRSGNSCGVGDFGDLRRFLTWASQKLGVEFVGLNPLHAIFNRQPYNASPYLASSRFYRNFIYLELGAIEDFTESGSAQDILRSDRVQERLVALRESDTVAYEDVAALKLELLEAAHAHFRQRGTGREDFERYREAEGPYLRNFASFCAIYESELQADPDAWSWTDWPEELQDPHGEAVGRFRRDNAERIEFFEYIQWHLDRQLAAAAEHARGCGMRIGLYLDQALALDRHGADFWAYRDLYVARAKTGAPPDPLAPQGQDWQFPPPDRERYRADAYRLFVEKIRRNCRHAGALRLDHVMRLMRLFWIPEGKTAADGAYVLDYHEDLLKIACLESVRNRTIIIGEDLGTVPDWIREKLARHGVLSYRVFYFERDRRGGFKMPPDYPRLSIATLTTHDLPTLTGYWEGSDIERRKQAGLLVEEKDVEMAKAEREAEKQRIASLVGLPVSAPIATLRDAIAAFLSHTHSALAMLNQEDVFLEREQQNMPGTTKEHLNWARKMLYSIEELETVPEATQAGERVRAVLERTGRVRSSVEEHEGQA